MTKQYEAKTSVTSNNLSDLFHKAKAHRVIVNRADGREFININLLAGGIITLLLTKLVVILVVAALLVGMKLNIVNTRHDSDDYVSDFEKTEELPVAL